MLCVQCPCEWRHKCGISYSPYPAHRSTRHQDLSVRRHKGQGYCGVELEAVGETDTEGRSREGILAHYREDARFLEWNNMSSGCLESGLPGER
ncbi:hypothetical protein RRG08_048497 [Elysia crispata]|uniref:Uncharacterized protein n=1 Tax=Elysia crispata TaxID=231223 RepID=A0AAE1DQS1_9GAST|nr:hypothetical protein RRG08_048497 [Elysia crispata]